jgi:methylthioribose-1-phosphate isomerase
LRVAGVQRRTIHAEDGRVVVLDQTRLPGEVAERELRTLGDAADAIRTMVVRGAPLIGVTAAFGVWLAVREDAGDAALARACDALAATRPTAVNLRWALERVRAAMGPIAREDRDDAALALAMAMADEDVAACEAIGHHGAQLLRTLWESLGRPAPFHVLTHCNAGWLATVDWGTALAPIYRLHDEGLDVHVWVDETRPRNQGLLTQWELAQHGVPCTLIVDNAGGLLASRGRVHACIVGADRVARNGDVCNKIGTYLKALAARDNGIPFIVAAPISTFDLETPRGGLIPIEERSGDEVTTAPGVRVENPAFDVTPARLVDTLVTERGTCTADEAAIGRHVAGTSERGEGAR